MGGHYSNNHIATKSYLKGWAAPETRNRVARVMLDDPLSRSELKHPKRVGARENFFGADPDVRRQTEERFSRFESKGIEALRRLEDSWPPEGDNRSDVACLVGIHIVLNPAFIARTTLLSDAEVQRKMTAYRETMTEEQIGVMLTNFQTIEFKIKYMLSLVLKQASLLAAMHWTVVEFTEPLLATSDQPVSVVPILEDGATAEVEAFPQTGFLGTHEIRFPIDPRRALLMTWIEGFDTERAVRASDDIAAEMNRTTIAQADREWFHHPSRRATRLKQNDLGDRFCRPVAQQLARGYTPEAARNSGRRRTAEKTLEEMIEGEVSNEIRWSRPVLAPDGY
jgi:hypothetical protein